MRHSCVRSVIRLFVLLAFASVAMAQGTKLPSKDSLYNGNRLKPDPTPGGPAPVRDISGSWAGNLTPDRGEIPALTPAGQKLFALNRPETEVGTGHSNDPMNTCDPLGIPRNTVFETRGLAFGTMGPDRMVVLHQYQRIWRYVWMDGKHPLPTKFDVPGGVPSRYYGYSVGRWEGDNTLVIDTVGLNEWILDAYHPDDGGSRWHSDRAHVVERIKFTDRTNASYDVTIDDPAIFTAPWIENWAMQKKPTWKIFEFVCDDNDRCRGGNCTASDAQKTSTQ